MNHQVPDELISAYFDGEATPDERAQVEHLLESSTELRQLLDDTSKLSALLHSFPREAAPAELASNVQRQIESKSPQVRPVPKRTSFRREWLSFAGGMLATAASLTIYLVVNPNHRPIGELEDFPKAAPEPVTAWKDAPPAARSLPKGVVEMKDAPEMVARFDDQQLNEGIGGGVNGLERLPVPESKEISQLTNDYANTANYVDGRMFEPPLEGDFLKWLKSGDVVTTTKLDPSNHVAVVQLTVVDREKTADGLRVVFHKHSVNPVEDRERSVKLSTKTAADDLLVMYVRASGPRLAEAISEFKNHPDIHFKMQPQLPLELGNSAVNPQVTASNELAVNYSGPAMMDGTGAGNNEQPSVSDEGTYVVQSYAEQNGGVVMDDSAKNVDETVAATESSRMAVKKSQGESIASDKALSSRSKQDVQSDAVAKLSTRGQNAHKNVANSTDASRNDPAQGYKTFHLVLGSQRQREEQVIAQPAAASRIASNQPAPAPAATAPISPFARSSLIQQNSQTNGMNPLNGAVGGNTISNNTVGNPYGGMPNNAGRGQYSSRARAASDNDRLVKLLIILQQEKQEEAAKAESPDTQDKPQPPPP